MDIFEHSPTFQKAYNMWDRLKNYAGQEREKVVQNIGELGFPEELI